MLFFPLPFYDRERSLYNPKSATRRNRETPFIALIHNWISAQTTPLRKHLHNCKIMFFF